MTPSVTQNAVNSALGNFLLAVLGLPATQVIVGQVNRVASPEGDYAVMWPLRRARFSTNLDTTADCEFTASISTTNMTVTAVEIGALVAGATVFGPGVAANTIIQSGPGGGAGIYVVSPSQNVASEVMQAGQTQVTQSTEVVMQVDVHGPNSADNAQTISTLFRDAYAVQQMAGTGVTPLYADDPKQIPFITAAKQYDQRWIVEVHLEIDPTVFVPQEYADAATIVLKPVETLFPT